MVTAKVEEPVVSLIFQRFIILQNEPFSFDLKYLLRNIVILLQWDYADKMFMVKNHLWTYFFMFSVCSWKLFLMV